MKYIKFGFVLICLFMFAQGTDARPRPSRWSETSYSQEERETKLRNEHLRETNERNRRRAEELNARATGPRAAKAKPVTVYAPETEYTPVMYKLLKGEPLTVLIWKSARNKRRDYDTSVMAAFDAWFSSAKKLIEKQRRSTEFADVMPFLKRGAFISVNYTVGKANVVPPGDSLSINMYDTLEEVQSACGSSNVVGCMAPWDNDRLIIMYKDDPEFQTTLEHELGHVFGLEDEYISPKKMDATTHRSQKRPREKTRGGSIMSRSGQVECDDVDGLINLIDLWNECSSARAQNGWDSLCGDGTRYKCGEDKFFNTVEDALPVRKRRK